jgi:hypothetical protein
MKICCIIISFFTSITCYALDNGYDLYNSLGIISLNRTPGYKGQDKDLVDFRPSLNLAYERRLNPKWSLIVDSGLAYIHFSKIPSNEIFFMNSSLVSNYKIKDFKIGPMVEFRQDPILSDTSPSSSVAKKASIKTGISLTYSKENYVFQAKAFYNNGLAEQGVSLRRKLKVYGLDSFVGVNQSFRTVKMEQSYGVSFIVGISYAN